jgi:DNA-binding beta-propeller fold protein YncE
MIIENLLTPKQAYELQNTILSKPFPWFWGSPYIVNTAPKDELFQFTHSFYKDGIVKSKYYDLINPIVYELNQKTNIQIKRIKRIKANLIPRIITNEEWQDNIIHQDINGDVKENFISVIYYLHDCDGDTITYEDDKKTIVDRNTPKENSCYILNSKTWHRSSIPKENKRRVIINFVFEVESTDIKLEEKHKNKILPNIVLTTSEGILTFDLNTDKIIHHQKFESELNCPHVEGKGRKPFRPFGIAVDSSNYYIASNEKLGKFNKQTNKLESLIDVPLYINTHQIIKENDTVYVANTSTDTIGIYKLNRKHNIFFDVNTLSIVDEPSKPLTANEKDTRHINSLFDDGNNIWFCLHNRGLKPTEYGYFNKTALEAQIIYSTGYAGHGIIIKDNFLYTLSTGTGELIAIDLINKKESRYKIVDSSSVLFLRGLVYINGKFLIGCSVNFKTPNPIKECYIAEVDIIEGTLKRHNLEGIQAINDMQIFE